MTGTLLVALSIIVLVGGAIWAANRWGAAEARLDSERKRVEVKDDQLRAAVDAPRNIRSLIDRLRRSGF